MSDVQINHLTIERFVFYWLVQKIATDNCDWIDILLPLFERSWPYFVLLKRTISIVSRVDIHAYTLFLWLSYGYLHYSLLGSTTVKLHLNSVLNFVQHKLTNGVMQKLDSAFILFNLNRCLQKNWINYALLSLNA